MTTHTTSPVTHVSVDSGYGTTSPRTLAVAVAALAALAVLVVWALTALVG